MHGLATPKHEQREPGKTADKEHSGSYTTEPLSLGVVALPICPPPKRPTNRSVAFRRAWQMRERSRAETSVRDTSYGPNECKRDSKPIVHDA
jgi:hypothetical protein